ncbi:MAG TPA: hypothetical protein VGI40_18165 [Pirellulaceae bacterium]
MTVLNADRAVGNGECPADCGFLSLPVEFVILPSHFGHPIRGLIRPHSGHNHRQRKQAKKGSEDLPLVVFMVVPPVSRIFHGAGGIGLVATR